MLDIVIVNWNSGNQLQRCVSSISSSNPTNIIVVDNHSSDNSIYFLNSTSGITIVQASSNLGFGKACNLGASLNKSEFILFLNPDTVLYPGVLDMVLEYMVAPENYNVGICGIQLVDVYGKISRSCTRFPTPLTLLAHSIGIDRIFNFCSYFMEDWSHNSTDEVDHVIGAFYFMRRTLFDLLDGFDERFFVYLEDLDFSRRANQLGWRILYLSDVKSFHAGGGCSKGIKSKRMFYSLRSRLLYAHKHFGPSSFIVVCLTTFLIEPISRSVLAISRCSWASLRETWAGYLMLWRWFPQWVLKGVTR